MKYILGFILIILIQTTAFAATPIYKKTDLLLSSPGDSVKLSNDLTAIIAALNSITVFAKINPTIDSYHSVFGASNDTTFNSYLHVYVSDGKLGFEIRRQNGGDIYKSSKIDINLINNTENALAFSASPITGYRLFLNGKKILDIPATSNYGLFTDINGINSAYIGKTDRKGSANDYIYYGKIHDIELYDSALNDSLLEQMTYIDISDREPVQSFNYTKKNSGIHLHLEFQR